MEKTGKGPTKKPGGPSSPPPSETQFENPPEIPEPPVNVAVARLPRLALASRSPLSVAFRWIRPNWRCFIQYADLAARKGNTAMQRIIDVYNSLDKKDRVNIWPEQLCDMANVMPDELVGAVCQNVWASKAAESSMISSIAHPELLLDTIKFARKEENHRDRELCFRMMGSLPDKKGTSINIFNQAVGQNAEVPLPSVVGKAKLKSFDAEVIDMDRDLADPPFLVRPADVPQEDN